MNTLFSGLKPVWSGVMDGLTILKRLDRKLDDLARHQLALEAKLDAQGELLNKLLAVVGPRAAVRVAFDVELESGEILTGVTELKIKARQHFRVTLRAFDADNNEAPYDGKPEFSVPEGIATFTPDPDNPQSGIVTGIGLVGTGQVSGKVDADLGEGVKPIVGTLALETLPGEAVVVRLDAGPAED